MLLSGLKTYGLICAITPRQASQGFHACCRYDELMAKRKAAAAATAASPRAAPAKRGRFQLDNRAKLAATSAAVKGTTKEPLGEPEIAAEAAEVAMEAVDTAQGAPEAAESTEILVTQAADILEAVPQAAPAAEGLVQAAVAACDTNSTQEGGAAVDSMNVEDEGQQTGHLDVANPVIENGVECGSAVMGKSGEEEYAVAVANDVN